MAFEGLPESEGPATWMFRTAQPAEEHSVGRMFVGSEQVTDELEIRLYRGSDRSLIVQYSAYGLGEFHITRDGSTISWRPGPNPWLAAVRWVLLGRVMATAMYAGGTLCLHGSAVSLHGQGICFLAPKFHGKSTLAGALVASGACLISDDVVPITVGQPILMHPGVPVLRLRHDSERVVPLRGREVNRAAEDVGKARFDFGAHEALVREPCPLRAVYILAPSRAEPEPGIVAVRDPVQGIRALEALTCHASIAPLLSATEGGLLFTHAAAVARGTPIFVLRSLRDLDRLEELVSQIWSWHSPTAAVAMAAERALA